MNMQNNAMAGMPNDEPEHEAGNDGAQFNDLTAENVFEPDSRVEYVLWNRISMADQAEVMMLDQMVTPQNVAIWLKFFPEIAPIIQKSSAMQTVMGMSQEDIMTQGGGMPQQVTQAPQPMGNGLGGQRFGG